MRSFLSNATGVFRNLVVLATTVALASGQTLTDSASDHAAGRYDADSARGRNLRRKHFV